MRVSVVTVATAATGMLRILGGLTACHAQPTAMSPCTDYGWAQPPAVLELTYQQPAQRTTYLNFNCGSFESGQAPNVDSLLCVSFSKPGPRFESGDCDLVFTSTSVGPGEVPSVATNRTLYMSIQSPSNTTGAAVAIFAYDVILLDPVFTAGGASVDLSPRAEKGQGYMLPASVATALAAENGVRLSIRGLPVPSKVALSVGRLQPLRTTCPQPGFVGDNLFAPASGDPEILIPPSYLGQAAQYVVMISDPDGGVLPLKSTVVRMHVSLYNNCSVMVDNTRSACSVWGGQCKFPCDGMNECDATGKLPECVCAHGYSGPDCNTRSCTGGAQQPCEGSHGVFQRTCILNNQTLDATWAACKPVSCDARYSVDAGGYYCVRTTCNDANGSDGTGPRISNATFVLSLVGSAMAGAVVSCAVLCIVSVQRRRRDASSVTESSRPSDAPPYSQYTKYTRVN